MGVCLLTCGAFYPEMCRRHARYIFIAGSLAAAPPRRGYSTRSTPSRTEKWRPSRDAPSSAERAAHPLTVGFHGRRAALMKAAAEYTERSGGNESGDPPGSFSDTEPGQERWGGD